MLNQNISDTMKTGIDFREGISGTGGTQSWVQNVQGEKFHEEIQRTCRPKMPSTGNPNWNHNAIGLRADSGT